MDQEDEQVGDSWIRTRGVRIVLEAIELDREVRRKRPARHRDVRKWRVDAFGRDGAPLDQGEALDLSADQREQGRAIADRLSAEFGWEPESAFEWLIYGKYPRPFPLVEEVPGPFARTRQSWGHVRMTVPLEFPPHTVAKVYADARARGLERLTEDAPAFTGKPFEKRALDATVFAAERAESGQTWDRVYADWLARVAPRGWSYASVSAFTDAVRRVYRGLTGRDLEWKNRPGRPRKQKGTSDVD